MSTLQYTSLLRPGAPMVRAPAPYSYSDGDDGRYSRGTPMFAGARGVQFDEWLAAAKAFLHREGAKAQLNGKLNPFWVWNMIPMLLVPNSPADMWYRHYVTVGNVPEDPSNVEDMMGLGPTSSTVMPGVSRVPRVPAPVKVLPGRARVRRLAVILMSLGLSCSVRLRSVGRVLSPNLS